MRHRVALLAALVSSVGLVLSSPALAATPKRVRCSAFDLPGSRCYKLKVPVDRSGTVKGDIDLFYEIVPAKKKAKSTIAVFPGGPGAATAILGYDLRPILRKQMVDHDLLLFDQRGTGRSGYLDCDKQLEAGASQFLVGDNARVIGKGVQRCAKALGAKRSFFTTRDTVQDLEAVRQAAAIDRMTLLGVSYGTRDATAYARAYPARVDRIVLDSLVSDEGLDAFGLRTIRAVPRLLRQLCRGGGCDSITPDVDADLRSLVAQLEKAPMRSRRPVILAGCATRVAITRSRLFGLFQEADEDPELLAQLPTAIHQAAIGRPYELSLLLSVKSPRLAVCSLIKLFQKFFPGQGRAAADEDQRLVETAFSAGEQVARLCEESNLPWPRSSLPSMRGAYAEDALDQLSDASFAPFDRATVLSASLVSLCKFWPEAPEAPVTATGPLPQVPTLILAGLDDLRTPAEDALALAAATPSSQFLVIPDVGHSTLTTSGCARRGLNRFMADEPIGQCHRYPTHHPKPARHVKPWQQELEQLLNRIPKPKRAR